ncbi:MAG: tail-specific protease, partial [Methyloversatilis sp.]|nr:tail-specific protease [Methyloversatilis sp.]
MKLKTFWIVFALATSAQAATTATMATPLRPVEAHALAAQASAELLSRFHYQNVPLDDALSIKIFDRYLKTLDPDRIYFLQSDIDTFGAVRTLLDDAILQQRLEAPFAIFTRYSQRVRERLADARVLLATGFDFNKPDSYRYVRTDAPWASSEAELKEIWRKRVKNDWLRLK